AGTVRQLPVQNHQVVIVALQMRPAFEAGAGDGNRVLLEGEPICYRLQHLRVIINYQDFGHNRVAPSLVTAAVRGTRPLAGLLHCIPLASRRCALVPFSIGWTKRGTGACDSGADVTICAASWPWRGFTAPRRMRSAFRHSAAAVVISKHQSPGWQTQDHQR